MATQRPPPPRRSKSGSAAGSASVSVSRPSSVGGRTSEDGGQSPPAAAAGVPLPPSRPVTPPAAPEPPVEDDPMEQDPPPVPRLPRPMVGGGAAPSGGAGAPLVPWHPRLAPTLLGACALKACYEAIAIPKQGPAWQRWLQRHPAHCELPAGVTADLPALLEAGDASVVTRVAALLESTMDEATVEDVTPVVSWDWACLSPPYLGEKDPHVHHHDVRAERRVREASGILVSASQVESTQIHAPNRQDYYVPTPTWWPEVDKPHGFPARMPRIVAYFGTVLRRGETTPAAAILATQWVVEVAGVWYASVRTKGYLWHLSPRLVGHLVRLRGLAEGPGPEAGSYYDALVALHESLDWEAVTPYVARQVVEDEEEGVPRAFVHGTKRLVGGRLALCEGLGDASYPYAPGVTPSTPPPPCGWGSTGAATPPLRKRTRGVAERPPARGGDSRRLSRAGSASRPTFSPPGLPYNPMPESGLGLSRGSVPDTCAEALASTFPSAAVTLRTAHGEAIVASLVDTLTWVVRGARAVLRDSPSRPSGAAEQFLVDTTPEAIGYQMATRLEAHGRRVRPAPVATGGGGGSTGVPPWSDPVGGSGGSYWGGGYTYPSPPVPAASAGPANWSRGHAGPSSSQPAASAGHATWGGGYPSAGAGPSRAPRSGWGSAPSSRGPPHEYPFEPQPRAHYPGYARGDTPPSPDRDV